MNISGRSTAIPLISHRGTSSRSGNGPRADWFRPLHHLKVLFEGLTLMSAGTSSKRTVASSARTPFAGSLSVAPSIATANMPRLLTITAYFPIGCGPSTASVYIVDLDGARTLEVRLDSPNPDFAFSDLVLAPYSVELSYTPSAEGDLPVRIMTSDGVLVGESLIMTRGTKGDDAQFDVTGKWIDPATNETGLAFAVDSPSQDSVVGTWNFHDYQGVSHRYSIEGMHWKEPDVEAEGVIFETNAAAPSPDLASPQPVTSNQLGLARITFHGLKSARIFALGFGGNVLFTSNLIRSTF